MNFLTNEPGFIRWWPKIEVAKFNPDITREVTEHLGYEPRLADFQALGIKPDDMAYGEGNELTTAGLVNIATRLIGNSGNAFSPTNSAIGVGNGTTTFDPVQTDLSGASKYFRVTDTPGPSNASGSSATITAVATFGASDANFAWAEWCWVATNAAATSGATKPNGVMINRKVQALGTKAAGASWTLTTTVALS